MSHVAENKATLIVIQTSENRILLLLNYEVEYYSLLEKCSLRKNE